MPKAFAIAESHHPRPELRWRVQRPPNGMQGVLRKIRPQKKTEIQLLVKCCATRLDSDRIRKINGLVAEKTINWDLLRILAIAHGVLPILYRTLTNTSVLADEIPSSVLDQIRATYNKNRSRNLVTTVSLMEAVRLLENSGIAAIPFKGPTLAELYFGDLALRCFCDLDILIDPGDVNKALNLLHKNGYRPRFDLDGKQIDRYARDEYSLELANTNFGGVGHLDLHWELTGRFSHRPFGMKLLCSRVRETRFCGELVRQMATEDLLVYLCFHGSKGRWRRLESICDVSEVISSKSDLDWDCVFATAERVACSRRLRLGLYLAKKVVAVSLPDEVASRLRVDSAMLAIADDVRSKLSADREPKNLRSSDDFSTFHVRVSDSRLDSVRFVLRGLFYPSRADWETRPLPPNLHFLYFLFRPFRLVEKAIARFLNLKAC